MPDRILLTPRRMCHVCEAFLGYEHKDECPAGGVVQYGDTVEKFTSIENSDTYPPKPGDDPYADEVTGSAGPGAEPVTQKPQLSSREKNERALGRAAHPRALDRLHEIFPEAEVGVFHGTVARFMGSPRARYTTVSLSTPDGDVVANTQWTYAPVQWDRRRSLARAFHCLLKDVCERTNEAERAMGDAGKGS